LKSRDFGHLISMNGMNSIFSFNKQKIAFLKKILLLTSAEKI